MNITSSPIEKLKKIQGGWISPHPPQKIEIIINGPILMKFYLGAHYMITNPSPMTKLKKKIGRGGNGVFTPPLKIKIFINCPILMKFYLGAHYMNTNPSQMTKLKRKLGEGGMGTSPPSKNQNLH